jgi:uncharacterized membrane protein YkoI
VFHVTNRLKKIVLGVAALAALALGGSAIAGAASGGTDSPAQTPAAAPENSGTDTDNVQDENGKDDATEGSEKGDGAGSDQGDASDKPVAAANAERARQAALAETGGGKAGNVEADNEKGASYDVEVTKTDGTTVDVQLDDQFKVVAVDKGGDNQDEAGDAQQ